MPNKIFISYRRVDSAAVTGRLYDELSRMLGEEYLFKDLHNIELGDDFREVINTSIRESSIVLVVIGVQFSRVTNDRGELRLFDEGDYVRIEIASGFQQGKRVIPVLVNEAAMPQEAQLPEDLRQLPYQNAFALRNSRWKDDTRSLGILLAEQLEIEIKDNSLIDRKGILKWVGVLLLYSTLVIAFLAVVGKFWEGKILEQFVPLIFYVAPFIASYFIAISARAVFILTGSWSMIYFFLLFQWVQSDERIEGYWYFILLILGLSIYYFILPLFSKKQAQ